MSSIELNAVAKSWDQVTALHSMQLRIEPGSFCVLLGPSGCGKSTTLRIIAGLETATSGQVLIDGKDVTHLPPAQRGVAMVFQNYALFPHLTVADNIQFGLSVRKVPKSEAAQRLLVEDRRRRARAAFIDDETDGVGADVDDRDRRADGQSPPRDVRRHVAAGEGCEACFS